MGHAPLQDASAPAWLLKVAHVADVLPASLAPGLALSFFLDVDNYIGQSFIKVSPFFARYYQPHVMKRPAVVIEGMRLFVNNRERKQRHLALAVRWIIFGGATYAWIFSYHLLFTGRFLGGDRGGILERCSCTYRPWGRGTHPFTCWCSP